MNHDWFNMDKLTGKQQDALDECIENSKKVITWMDACPQLEETSRALIIADLASLSEQGEGLDEEEIKKIISWVTKQHIDFLLISGVARGLMAMRWDDDTDQPMFALTKRGEESAASGDMTKLLRAAANLDRAAKPFDPENN